MAEINKKSRLKRQLDEAAKARASAASVTMLLRQGSTAAGLDTRNRFNSSSSKLRTLGPKFDAAQTRTSSSVDSQAAKQHADQIIAAFKRRQATRGARETLQDFKTAARPLQPRTAFNGATREPKAASQPTLKTTDAFNKATGNTALTPKGQIFDPNRIARPGPQKTYPTHITNERHTREALRRAQAIKGPKAVLGRNPEYKQVGVTAGTRRFVIPDKRYEAMNQTWRWRFNKRFLDRQIRDGARIVLTTPISKAAPGGPYANEIAYLRSKGYVVSKDGLEMYKP